MIDKVEKNKPNKIYALLLLGILIYGALAFGLLGAFFGLVFGDWSPLKGFLDGAVIGAVIGIASLAGYFGWEWIKKEADKGKLLPYMLCGMGAAIAISGIFAMNLGQPSCEEQGDAPYSNCVTYANDDFVIYF